MSDLTEKINEVMKGIKENSRLLKMFIAIETEKKRFRDALEQIKKKISVAHTNGDALTSIDEEILLNIIEEALKGGKS